MSNKQHIDHVEIELGENQLLGGTDQTVLGTRNDGAREIKCRIEFLKHAQKLGFTDRERDNLIRIYGSLGEFFD